MTLGRPGALLAARYRLDRLVGNSGSAERWQAYDERLARPVTARLMPAAGDAAHEEAAQAALERLARLNHPGVAALYDVGTVDDPSTLGTGDVSVGSRGAQGPGDGNEDGDGAGNGDEDGDGPGAAAVDGVADADVDAEADAAVGAVSYAISEWTDGRTLGQIMETGPQPWPRVADWGQQIGGALAALHALGIVHSALGPNSIAIHDDRQVKILDAGLGQVIDIGTSADAGGEDDDKDEDEAAARDDEAGGEASAESSEPREADGGSVDEPGERAEGTAESAEGAEGPAGSTEGAEGTGESAEEADESGEATERVDLHADVPAGAADDIRALGLLLWEAAIGAAPAFVKQDAAEENALESDLELLRDTGVPAELAALLAEMVDEDPARRPAAAVAQQRFGPFAPVERVGDTLPEIPFNVATAAIATTAVGAVAGAAAGAGIGTAAGTGTGTSAGAAGAGTGAGGARARARTQAIAPPPQAGGTSTNGLAQHGGPPPGAVATVARLTAERERRRRRGVLLGLALLLAVIGVGAGLLIANLTPSNTANPGVGDTTIPTVSPGTVTLPSGQPSSSPSSVPSNAAPVSSRGRASSSPSSSAASRSASAAPSSSVSSSPSAGSGGSSSPVATSGGGGGVGGGGGPGPGSGSSAPASPSAPASSPGVGPVASGSAQPSTKG